MYSFFCGSWFAFICTSPLPTLHTSGAGMFQECCSVQALTSLTQNTYKFMENCCNRLQCCPKRWSQWKLLRGYSIYSWWSTWSDAWGVTQGLLKPIPHCLSQRFLMLYVSVSASGAPGLINLHQLPEYLRPVNFDDAWNTLRYLLGSLGVILQEIPLYWLWLGNNETMSSTRTSTAREETLDRSTTFPVCMNSGFCSSCF